MHILIFENLLKSKSLTLVYLQCPLYLLNDKNSTLSY